MTPNSATLWPMAFTRNALTNWIYKCRLGEPLAQPKMSFGTQITDAFYTMMKRAYPLIQSTACLQKAMNPLLKNTIPGTILFAGPAPMTMALVLSCVKTFQEPPSLLPAAVIRSKKVTFSNELPVTKNPGAILPRGFTFYCRLFFSRFFICFGGVCLGRVGHRSFGAVVVVAEVMHIQLVLNFRRQLRVVL